MLVVALMMLAFVGRGKTVPLMTASRLEVKFEVGPPRHVTKQILPENYQTCSIAMLPVTLAWTFLKTSKPKTIAALQVFLIYHEIQPKSP